MHNLSQQRTDSILIMHSTCFQSPSQTVWTICGIIMSLGLAMLTLQKSDPSAIGGANLVALDMGIPRRTQSKGRPQNRRRNNTLHQRRPVDPRSRPAINSDQVARRSVLHRSGTDSIRAGHLQRRNEAVERVKPRRHAAPRQGNICAAGLDVAAGDFQVAAHVVRWPDGAKIKGFLHTGSQGYWHCREGCPVAERAPCHAGSIIPTAAGSHALASGCRAMRVTNSAIV